jgi:hypothetical protein
MRRRKIKLVWINLKYLKAYEACFFWFSSYQMFFEKFPEFSSRFLACRKNVKDASTFFLSNPIYNKKNWLNYLMDDGHFS